MYSLRLVIRAVGFFLVVFAVIAVSYPLLEGAVSQGKEEFLSNPIGNEQFNQLQSEKGVMAVLPLRLYVSRVYRVCYQDMEELCKEVGGTDSAVDGARCLVGKVDEIADNGCSDLLLKADLSETESE